MIVVIDLMGKQPPPTWKSLFPFFFFNGLKSHSWLNSGCWSFLHKQFLMQFGLTFLQSVFLILSYTDANCHWSSCVKCRLVFLLSGCSVHSSECLEKENEELHAAQQDATERLQEQHQKDLAELEQRLQAAYQAEWDKVHLTYQEDVDRCKALMQQQVGPTFSHLFNRTTISLVKLRHQQRHTFYQCCEFRPHLHDLHLVWNCMFSATIWPIE